MPPETICKTVHQYSSEPISDENMEKLQEIAVGYGKVKNYVYARYGGRGSLSKLYPGYTIQNEMTKSGLRAELDLPSVYFYLAMFDALGDIKSQWTKVKTKVSGLAAKNENFTAEDRHYLRFLLKVNNAFEAVLNERPVCLDTSLQPQYEMLAAEVDTERLNRYLCRQVRKYYNRQHTDRTEGFSISAKAYRYGEHGIYIATREKRKRVFVPLTDNNQYAAQLYIRLYMEEKRLEIRVPVNVAVRVHEDYNNHVGVSTGLFTMLTTDEGHKYGEHLGEYQSEYAEWIRKQTGSYNRNRKDNPGRKKYQAKKRRYEEKLHSYINQELNRFLKTEKPCVVYMPKLPGTQAGGVNRKINHMASMWQRGYLKSRLIQKCKEQSVELREVFGKDIGRQCSQCGAMGEKNKGMFTCAVCGYEVEDKVNAARNAKGRGMESSI